MVRATRGTVGGSSLLELHTLCWGGCPLSPAFPCRAAGHQFAGSFRTERKAGAAAVFSGKLWPPDRQPCRLENPSTGVNHTNESWGGFQERTFIQETFIEGPLDTELALSTRNVVSGCKRSIGP